MACRALSMISAPGSSGYNQFRSQSAVNPIHLAQWLLGAGQLQCETKPLTPVRREQPTRRPAGGRVSKHASHGCTTNRSVKISCRCAVHAPHREGHSVMPLEPDLHQGPRQPPLRVLSLAFVPRCGTADDARVTRLDAQRQDGRDKHDL